MWPSFLLLPLLSDYITNFKRKFLTFWKFFLNYFADPRFCRAKIIGELRIIAISGNCCNSNLRKIFRFCHSLHEQVCQGEEKKDVEVDKRPKETPNGETEQIAQRDPPKVRGTITVMVHRQQIKDDAERCQHQ